jgi:hypothetical protein
VLPGNVLDMKYLLWQILRLLAGLTVLLRSRGTRAGLAENLLLQQADCLATYSGRPSLPPIYCPTLTAERSINQAKSLRPTASKPGGLKSLVVTRNLVVELNHLWISEWPSANESPPAPL